MKEVILVLIGFCIIALGWLFALWLGIYVMLYGGIMAAIENWGVNNSVVVWGIIRAVFFELSFLVGWLLSLIGTGFLQVGSGISRSRFGGFRS